MYVIVAFIRIVYHLPNFPASTHSSSAAAGAYFDFSFNAEFWWINGAGRHLLSVVGILASNKGVVIANGQGKGFGGGGVYADDGDLLRVVCLIRRVAWLAITYTPRVRSNVCVLHSQNAERWLFARGSLMFDR